MDKVFEILVYLACVIFVGFRAYELGWTNGNQVGFKQCSKIWEKEYKL